MKSPGSSDYNGVIAIFIWLSFLHFGDWDVGGEVGFFI